MYLQGSNIWSRDNIRFLLAPILCTCPTIFPSHLAQSLATRTCWSLDLRYARKISSVSRKFHSGHLSTMERLQLAVWSTSPLLWFYWCELNHWFILTSSESMCGCIRGEILANTWNPAEACRLYMISRGTLAYWFNPRDTWSHATPSSYSEQFPPSYTDTPGYSTIFKRHNATARCKHLPGTSVCSSSLPYSRCQGNCERWYMTTTLLWEW